MQRLRKAAVAQVFASLTIRADNTCNAGILDSEFCLPLMTTSADSAAGSASLPLSPVSGVRTQDLPIDSEELVGFVWQNHPSLRGQDRTPPCWSPQFVPTNEPQSGSGRLLERDATPSGHALHGVHKPGGESLVQVLWLKLHGVEAASDQTKHYLSQPRRLGPDRPSGYRLIRSTRK